MWRRIVQLPFVEVIPKVDRDPDLKRRLKLDPAAQSAVLEWAVQGCLEWQRDGLGIPERVIDYTEEYRQENDPFAQFLEDCCDIGDSPTAFTLSSHLRAVYEAWGAEQGEKTFGARSLASALEERGCKSGRDKRGRRGWNGITLKRVWQTRVNHVKRTNGVSMRQERVNAQTRRAKVI